MRIRYSYIEYKYSPKATLYSRIVGLVSMIVGGITLICTLILFGSLFDWIANARWSPMLAYSIIVELACVGYFVLLLKLINPQIQKIAFKDADAVRRGVKKPGDF